MERIYTNQVKDYIGKDIKVKGWVHIVRDQGSIAFVLLRDVTGLIQSVASKDSLEMLEAIKKLTHESVVEITGIVKEEKQAPGGIEIGIKTITILSASDPELPIPV